MTGIEVVDPLQGNTSVALTKTMVKENLNIADVIKNQGKRLLGFIRKRVQSREDADDILQDVYYQLAEADRLMKPIDQVSAWLFTVARNRITDWYRKKKTKSMPEFIAQDEEEEVKGLLGELLFDNGNTPETEYLRALVWSELEKALDELPEEQRLVFELTEMKGLSFKTISSELDIPVNTLISRKRYAVLYLRQRLQLIYDELINF